MKLSLANFYKYKEQFSLGHLTTESFHSKSEKLSNVLNKDVYEALDILKSIDVDALTLLKEKKDSIYSLAKDCHDVFKAGKKIYLSGCGATGRLALSIEKIFRAMKEGDDSVIGFMAGGDYALIKSVESFEDNTKYGAKQLQELGFQNGDLLLGITEGGETSFVIGSVEFAAANSSRDPWFVYCNPDKELASIERSHRLISNEKIKKLNLTTGAMAISGSTRMQATTVQMLAVGFAVIYDFTSPEDFNSKFENFIDELIGLNYELIASFLEKEKSVYQRGGLVTYNTNADLGIALLTDTTERAPTFNLQGFEKDNEDHLSLSYLSLFKEKSAKQAWFNLLGRTPRGLEWDELPLALNNEELYKFNISAHSWQRRNQSSKEHQIFEVLDSIDNIEMNFMTEGTRLNTEGWDLFKKHMALKLIMNGHSTSVMGLLGRFEGNIMTYVKPSNMKLIDRAMRYIKELLAREGVMVSDDQVLEQIFKFQPQSSKPIVLLVRDYFLKK